MPSLAQLQAGNAVIITKSKCAVHYMYDETDLSSGDIMYMYMYIHDEEIRKMPLHVG